MNLFHGRKTSKAYFKKFRKYEGVTIQVASCNLYPGKLDDSRFQASVIGKELINGRVESTFKEEITFVKIAKKYEIVSIISEYNLLLMAATDVTAMVSVKEALSVDACEFIPKCKSVNIKKQQPIEATTLPPSVAHTASAAVVVPVIPSTAVVVPVLHSTPVVVTVLPSTPVVVPVLPSTSEVLSVPPSTPKVVPVVPSTPEVVPALPSTPVVVPVNEVIVGNSSKIKVGNLPVNVNREQVRDILKTYQNDIVHIKCIYKSSVCSAFVTFTSVERANHVLASSSDIIKSSGVMKNGKTATLEPVDLFNGNNGDSTTNKKGNSKKKNKQKGKRNKRK